MYLGLQKNSNLKSIKHSQIHSRSYIFYLAPIKVKKNERNTIMFCKASELSQLRFQSFSVDLGVIVNQYISHC